MFEDKTQAKEQRENGPKYWFWKCMIVVIFIELGIFIYSFSMSQNSFTPFVPIRENPENNLVVTGKDGLYFLELPTFKTTLKDANNRFVFLNTTISLELSKLSDKKEIVSILPRIQDTFHLYLSEITIEEIQKSGNLFRIKEALLERINFLIAPSHVNDVLFKSMLIEQIP